MFKNHGIYISYVHKNYNYQAVVVIYDNGHKTSSITLPEEFASKLEAMDYGYYYAIDNLSSPDVAIHPPYSKSDEHWRVPNYKKYGEMFTTSQLVAMKFIDFDYFITGDCDIDYGREILVSLMKEIGKNGVDKNISEFSYFLCQSFNDPLITGFIKTIFMLKGTNVNLLTQEQEVLRKTGVNQIIALAETFKTFHLE